MHEQHAHLGSGIRIMQRMLKSGREDDHVKKTLGWFFFLAKLEKNETFTNNLIDLLKEWINE